MDTDQQELLLRERKHKLQDIERDIADLRQLQLDLATLVEQQNTQIDHIEDIVVITNDRVAEGNRELVQAVEYQRSYGKLRAYILLGAGVVLVATTPVLSIGAKLAGPIATAAVSYPKVSIPLAALFTLKIM